MYDNIEYLKDLILVQEEDPLIVTHVSDVLLSVDKNKEAILLLAEKIREFPYLVPLLLKQAQAFIKSEYYEYAYKLSKICVDLCPESFEAWFQMAEVYFYMKKIKMVPFFFVFAYISFRVSLPWISRLTIQTLTGSIRSNSLTIMNSVSLSIRRRQMCIHTSKLSPLKLTSEDQ